MKMEALYAITEFWAASLEGIFCMWVTSLFQAVVLHPTSHVCWLLCNRKVWLSVHSSYGARGGKHRLDLYLTTTSFLLGAHVRTITDFWPCTILWFPVRLWNLSSFGVRVEKGDWEPSFCGTRNSFHDCLFPQLSEWVWLDILWYMTVNW